MKFEMNIYRKRICHEQNIYFIDALKVQSHKIGYRNNI